MLLNFCGKFQVPSKILELRYYFSNKETILTNSTGSRIAVSRF